VVLALDDHVLAAHDRVGDRARLTHRLGALSTGQDQRQHGDRHEARGRHHMLACDRDVIGDGPG
jgi:hypothetical protein